MAQAKTKATKTYTQRGTQIALRVDENLLALIDGDVERMKRERPGLSISRAEVVRDIVYQHFQGERRVAE
ncbi:MAG: hypothetical protein MUF34_19615 [Polyangiaceae bacterium]|jgi:hypothetical protein|nr:hypothetical protein [Polyangiaceae bacterium]